MDTVSLSHSEIQKEKNRECWRKYDREHRAERAAKARDRISKNRELIRLRAKEARARDPEKHREYARKYHRKMMQLRGQITRKVRSLLVFPVKTCQCGNRFATKADICKDCIKRKRAAARKARCLNNPEKHQLAKERRRADGRRQSKKYYAIHREAKLKGQRERYAANPQKVIEQTRRYYEANEKKMIAAKAAWVKAHRPKMNEYMRRRHAKKLNATIGDPEEIRKFYEMVYAAESIRCYWCKKNVPKGERNIDHIHPLNKLGAHAVLNLCCSCETCNKSKCDKLPESFNHGQLEMFTVTTPA